MSAEHTIPIATASPADSRRDGGSPVSVPVADVVTSNGLVAGQSGADPAASVERVVEALVDAGETAVVVDPGGEFESLTDDAAVLHAGGDRHCDVEVGPGAVDRVASLAVDGDTSVVLDLAAFDEDSADAMLAGLTDALADADRDRSGDFLLVVGECHRWLAAEGPATRTGENVVQLGGRRHDGVGVLGVTDQPGDLRRDVVTGVDWLLAHRLTWREDVRALEDVLGRNYTEDLDDLAAEEAFLKAGWERGVTRVRFGDDVREAEGQSAAGTSREAAADDTNDAREDAEATDDAGDDLLAGLAEASSPNADDSDEGAGQTGEPADQPTPSASARPDEVAALREDLAEMEGRVASLEAKLEAREDVEELADRIADAIVDGLQDVTVTASSEADRSRNGTANGSAGATEKSTGGNPRDGVASDSGVSASEAGDSSGDGRASADEDSDGVGGFGDVFDAFGDSDETSTAEARGGAMDDGGTSGTPVEDGVHDGGVDASDAGPPDDGTTNGDDDGGGMSFEPIDFGVEEHREDVGSTVPEDFGPPSRHGSSGRTIPRYLRKIVRGIEEMDVTTRRMLAHYVEEGTDSPTDAHFSAGGGSDRTRAYAHNRRLRTNGLIEHVGKGKYAPRLREYVVDQAGHSVPDHELDRAEEVIRQAVRAA